MKPPHLFALWLLFVSESAHATPHLTPDECARFIDAGRRDECFEYVPEVLLGILELHRGEARIPNLAGLLLQVLDWLGPEAYAEREGEFARVIPDDIRIDATWEARLRSQLLLGDHDAASRALAVAGAECRSSWCRARVRFWERELGLWSNDRRSRWEVAEVGSIRVFAKDEVACTGGALKIRLAPGHLSVFTLPQSNGIALKDLAHDANRRLRRNLERIGLEPPSAIELYLYTDSMLLCRLTASRCAPDIAHTYAFATPWISRAHVSCGQDPLHELIHVAIAHHGRRALDRFMDEGLAVALSGDDHFRQRYRCPELASYALRLTSLDELWLLFNQDAAAIGRLGEPPCGPYALAGSFAAFLVDRGGVRLGSAVQQHASRAALLRDAVGMTEDEAMYAWTEWLSSQPMYHVE